MKTASLILILAAHATATAVTPLAKVAEMLQRMETECIAARDAEGLQFNAADASAAETEAHLESVCSTQRSKLDELLIRLEACKMDADCVMDALADIEAEIAKCNGRSEGAEAILEAARARFAKLEQDYLDAISLIDQAIEVLNAYKKQKYEQAVSLLQKVQTLESVQAHESALTEVISQAQLSAQQEQAPSAPAYTPSVDKIVDLLKELRRKFKQELKDAEMNQGSTEHECALEMEDVARLQAALSKKKAELTIIMMNHQASGATLTEEQEEMADMLNRNLELLADVNHNREAGRAQFARNQQIREDECRVIGQVIEALNDPALVTLANRQAAADASFVQVAAHTTRAGAKKAYAHLMEAAGAQASQSLATVAKLIQSPAVDYATNEGMLKYIVDLIRNRINVLETQARTESTNKEACDTMMGDSKRAQADSKTLITGFETKIETIQMAMNELKSNVQEWTEEKVQLTDLLATLKEERNNQKERNEGVIAQAKSEQEACEVAINLFTEFYAALNPDLADPGDYTGMQDSKGGIIAMLEVIESDSDRLKDETAAFEKDEQARFLEIQTKGRSDIEQLGDNIQKANCDLTEQEWGQGKEKQGYSRENQKLDKEMEQWAKIEQQCAALKVSWEERSRHRQEEIEALQNAIDMMEESGL